MNYNQKILIIDSNLGYNIYPAYILSQYYNVDYYIYIGETLPKEETYLLGTNVVNRIYNLDLNKKYNIIMLMDSSIPINGIENIGNKYFGYSRIYDVRLYEQKRYILKEKLNYLIDKYNIDNIKIPKFYLFENIKELNKLLSKNKDKQYIIKPNVNIRFESFKISYNYSNNIKNKLEKLEWIIKAINDYIYVEEYKDNLNEIGGETIIFNGNHCGIFLIGTEGNIKSGYITKSDVLINNFFTYFSRELFPIDFNGIVSVEGGIDNNGIYWIYEMNIRLSQPTSLIWFKEFNDIFNIDKEKIDFKIKKYKYKQVYNEKINFYDTLTIDRCIIYDKISSNLLPQTYFKDKNGKYVFIGKRIGLEKI